MFKKQNVSLAAVALASMVMCGSAVAATADSTMTVEATLVNACEVSGTPAIQFGSFNGLLSVGDKTADSGSTFQVACTTSAAPKIYTTSARTLTNGTDTFPFQLSLTPGVPADDLPATALAGADPGMAKDGALHDVVIYAKVAAATYSLKPAGVYTSTVTLSVDY